MERRDAALIARVEAEVRRLVERGALDIAAACETGRRFGQGFTYESVQGLDKKVNLMLVERSDRCMEKTEELEREAVLEAGLAEDDEDAVIAWVGSSRFGDGAQGRFDSYFSHMKYILEGWLAIGFARKWSSAYIAARAASDADPYTTPEWRAAFRERGWGPDIISSGGYRWGRGIPVSPAKGIALGAGAMVTAAYRHAELVGYGRTGATGYRVRRGSNYPCALCDSLCRITWPISVEVLPAHPHCVCYAEPVYDGVSDRDGLYAERLAEYERYSADPNYKDVAFDRDTLGLKATHSGHNFNKRKGWYETTVQDIGYKAGHSVILGNEPQEIFKKKFPDGTWDGKRFEIAAAETGTPNNIRNALSHCASKPDSEVAVIFMPNGHDPKNIRAGIGKYEGLKGSPQYRKMEHVYFISGESIIYDYSPK